MTAQPALTASMALRPLAILAMAVGVVATHADPDLWGHVRFGLDILESRRVVSPIDPYAFTADRPFIYHEWLGGTFMGGAYAIGGPLGLQVLKAALAIALFALLWSVVRPRAATWRWTGMALAAFGGLPLLLTLRPQIWTALGLVLVCRILTSQSPRALWGLPPLFAAWANLHGGWLVGGGLVAIWTIVAILQRDPRAWPLLLAGATSLAATLLTPYGIDLWLFLGETVRFGRADISEWQPIWKVGLDSVALWTASVAVIGVSWRRSGRPPLPVFVALAAMAIASARVNRLGPLLALTAVSLLAGTWPDAEPDAPRMPGRAVIDGVGIIVGLVLAFAMHAVPTCIAIDRTEGPDTLAAESLRGRSGRVVTFFDWGEYAIWHFGPALQVSLDGRRETVYSPLTLNRQFGVANGTPLGLAELDRMRPDYVWLPRASGTTAAWLREHGYREDVRTPRSFVATRADVPRLIEWTGESSTCFPGP
jgi:hypothetical protein